MKKQDRHWSATILSSHLEVGRKLAEGASSEVFLGTLLEEDCCNDDIRLIHRQPIMKKSSSASMSRDSTSTGSGQHKMLRVAIKAIHRDLVARSMTYQAEAGCSLHPLHFHNKCEEMRGNDRL